MTEVKIDADRCSACELCVRVCGRGVLEMVQGQKFPQVNPDAVCSECGHCVAACPNNAVVHSGMNPAEIRPVGAVSVAPEQMRMFLASKRSIRRFADRPVERRVLDELIDLARFAPTAKNLQDRGFIVVTDRETIRAMDKSVVNAYRKLLKILGKPMRKVLGASFPVIRQLDRNAASLQNLIRRSDAGQFPVFHDAPCVVLGYGSSNNSLSRDNCVIAQQYLMLYAQSMGLGSCIIGYATNRPKALSPFIKLPAGQSVQTATILGYPDVTFARTVSRAPAQVSWV
jgi:nitroreductase/NAD-dependent dihydropyrimidine dehydrogenase PreA subunit